MPPTSRDRQATAQKEKRVSTSPHLSPEKDPSLFWRPLTYLTTPSTLISSVASSITRICAIQIHTFEKLGNYSKPSHPLDQVGLGQVRKER